MLTGTTLENTAYIPQTGVLIAETMRCIKGASSEVIVLRFIDAIFRLRLGITIISA